MVFFIAGYAMNEYYPNIKQWALKYWWIIYVVFIVAHVIFIKTLCQIPFVFRFILPVILGSVFVLQFITITIIVEVTRRIKWLKIPCGY